MTVSKSSKPGLKIAQSGKEKALMKAKGGQESSLS